MSPTVGSELQPRVQIRAVSHALDSANLPILLSSLELRALPYDFNIKGQI